MSESVETSSPEETEAFGRRMGESIAAGSALLLVGDLGAGKTLFARGLAAGLGIDPDEVTSPTFALVNRYDGGRLRMYHLDLYRIEGASADEGAYGLGLEDMLEEAGAVVVIEWADRLSAFPVPGARRVEITVDDADADRRRIVVSEA